MIPFYIYRALAFLLARYELIRVHGEPYLSRWHFPAWFARMHGCAELFLHHFHTSDDDSRGWHNHPYVWCESKLLTGAYTQEIRHKTLAPYPSGLGFALVWVTDYEDFRAGDRNHLEREFHRVLLASRPVWTLFRAGAKHGKSWGFIDRAGKFTPANAPHAREGMH